MSKTPTAPRRIRQVIVGIVICICLCLNYLHGVTYAETKPVDQGDNQLAITDTNTGEADTNGENAKSKDGELNSGGDAGSSDLTEGISPEIQGNNTENYLPRAGMLSIREGNAVSDTPKEYSDPQLYPANVSLTNRTSRICRTGGRVEYSFNFTPNNSQYPDIDGAAVMYVALSDADMTGNSLLSHIKLDSLQVSSTDKSVKPGTKVTGEFENITYYTRDKLSEESITHKERALVIKFNPFIHPSKPYGSSLVAPKLNISFQLDGSVNSNSCLKTVENFNNLMKNNTLHPWIGLGYKIPEGKMGVSVEEAKKTGGKATIKVRVAGHRISDSDDIKYLQGVKLQLHRNNNPKNTVERHVGAQEPGNYHWGTPGNAINEKWAYCISDTDGWCTFNNVPAPPKKDKKTEGIYYWVKEVTNSNDPKVQALQKAGWEPIDRLRVGFSGSEVPGYIGSKGPSYPLDYAYRTPPMYAGDEVTSGQGPSNEDGLIERWAPQRQKLKNEHITRRGGKSGFMNWWVNDSGGYYDFWSGEEGVIYPRASSGVMMTRHANPIISPKCGGLRIGLLVDKSTSMQTNEGQKYYKQQLKSFIDTIKGHNFEVSMLPFSDNASPVRETSEPQNIDRNGYAEKLKDRIQKIGLNGATNWDDAFRTVARYNTDHPTKKYDAVFIITDGNPTTVKQKGRSGPRTATDFLSVEHAMLSTNTIKKQGTHIYAVGVGAMTAGINDASPLNFKAITGPDGMAVESDFSLNNANKLDWIMMRDMSKLGEALTQIALSGCNARVTVEKQLNDNGKVKKGKDVVSTSGKWTFNATKPTNSKMTYTFNDIDGTVIKGGNGSAKGTTGADSKVTFEINMATPRDKGNITISEEQKDGWTMVKTPQIAVCKNNETKKTVKVKPHGEFGFGLEQLGYGTHIHCVVTNERKVVEPEGIIKVRKVSAGTADVGVEPKLLEGAEFILRPATKDGQPDWNAAPLTLETSDKGKTWTSGKLKAGTYFIVETKAPTGHSLLPVPIGITLTKNKSGGLDAALLNSDDSVISKLVSDRSNNVFTLTVEDQLSGGTLPYTGGSGVIWYLLASLCLIGLGIHACMKNSTSRKL